MNRLRRLAALVPVLLLAACASSTAPKPTPARSPEGDSAATQTLYAFTLMRQGSVLLQQGRYEDALQRFQEADLRQPGNATVYNMIGLCHLRLEQYDKALLAFDRALELIPSFTDARNNRGATYLALGQSRMAEVDFLAVLGDTTYPHRWEAFYNLGLSNLRSGQIGAAEENFRRAATAPAPVYDANLRLAQIVAQRGETEAAIQILEDTRLRFPERRDASLQLGRLFTQLGRRDEARALLQEVIAADPGSAMAREARRLLEEG